MKVKCKLCANFEDGFCQAKKSGGKKVSVIPNKNRDCKKYLVDPLALAAEADKEWHKNQIPRFSPTWRYYADEKILKEKGEKNGPKFIRTNPQFKQ